MNQLASLTRVAFSAAVVALLASACGGKSFVGGDGDEAGSSSEGGSGNHAGTGSKAGSGSSAGAGNATHTGGTAVGTGGTGVSTGGVGTGGRATAGAGGAGYAGEACTAGPDPGPCDAYLETWYHDPATGVCRPSFYGGCGGNQNRYASLAECQKTCSGGTPDYDSCQVPRDCTIAGTSCCGVCDGAGLDLHDFIAYNTKYASLLNCAILKEAPPAGAAPAGGSDGIGLPPACAPCPDPAGGGTLRYFVPDCVAGQCVVTDLRASPVTACKTSDECRLRSGTGCCEGCDGSSLIAVRNDGSFEKLVCGGIQPPCAACAPQPPNGAIPLCNEGRCTIAYSATAE
jgi:hypothetical protein